MVDRPEFALAFYDSKMSEVEARPAVRMHLSSPVQRYDWEARRERRIDLTNKTFGCLRVLGFVGVTHRKAIWRAECLRDRGGCGRTLCAPGSALRKRRHCGCQLAPRYAFAGVTLSLREWAQILATKGVALTAAALRWRLENRWPIDRALTTPIKGAR
jgi:hypothetical protein